MVIPKFVITFYNKKSLLYFLMVIFQCNLWRGVALSRATDWTVTRIYKQIWKNKFQMDDDISIVQ